PWARGRMRLTRGPASTVTDFTVSTLPRTPPSCLTCQFETADLRTFSTMRADFLRGPSPNRMAEAASTDFPRIRSATRRMRLVEDRKYLPLAVASMPITPYFAFSDFT